jgi:RNA polymerase sigma-32 factor
MNRRLGGDASLNAPVRADAEGGGEWQDWLVDDTPDQEERLAESEELSQVYGVSRERIRQIEVRAFEKLQAALLRLAGERRLLPAA